MLYATALPVTSRYGITSCFSGFATPTCGGGGGT